MAITAQQVGAQTSRWRFPCARKTRFVFKLGLVVLLLGCKSHPLGPYISPRVEGEVVEADSAVPLSGVKVIRGNPVHDALSGSPKGGQLLMTPAPAETGRDGRFSLPSERVLSVVRGAGWNEVQLTFIKAGYERFQTYISLSQSTNSERGEPVVWVGRTSLRRSKR